MHKDQYQPIGQSHDGVSRRVLMKAAAGLAAAAAVPSSLIATANAADDTVGTYPAGANGPSIFVGIGSPRTGTYASAGEDQIKGYELAIEHLNSGHELMRKISPRTTKGVLGKQVVYGIGDTEGKPNTAVQVQSRFISENKAMLITGSVSSAVAVAINKLADREKVIYLPCITASNDTTGKDCARYSFRECIYGESVAQALAPLLVKTHGKGKKIAFLTPDYNFGHTVRQSMEEVLKAQGGWTVVTNQISPLGTTDYSSYLLNVANSGADIVINIHFGRDCVLAVKQSAQFGILDRMSFVVPFKAPFLAQEVGQDVMKGIIVADNYWWTLEDRYPVAKMFNAAFREKHKYYPEWGAGTAYMQIAMWADAVERAKSFYPPDVIKAYEAGATIDSIVGPVRFRPEDHQLIRPVVILKGKKPTEMKSTDDYYELLDVVDTTQLMQKPDAFGCKLGTYT
jgi:branched-chain amino acid transport system substrate-binding protein